MVLAYPVGHARGHGIVAYTLMLVLGGNLAAAALVLAFVLEDPVPLLFAFAFGATALAGLVLSLVWQWRAHSELYRQFELRAEGRKDGLLWFVLGIFFSPLQLLYMWVFVSNVEGVRRRCRLAPGISPGRFLAYVLVPNLGLLLLALALQVVDSSGVPDTAQLIGVAVGLGAVAVAGAILGPLAYGRLQSSLNGVWEHYGRRMAQLQPPPAPAAWGPSPSQWGPPAGSMPQWVPAQQAAHPRLAPPPAPAGGAPRPPPPRP